MFSLNKKNIAAYKKKDTWGLAFIYLPRFFSHVFKISDPGKVKPQKSCR